MNPPLKSSRGGRCRLGPLGPVLGLALSLVAPLASAGEPPPSEAKPFVLFMGADIDVELNKKSHRVKNVAGDAFVVSVNERPVEVPMNRGSISMKVAPQLKLTNKTAAVQGLVIERAYTPDNDPTRKWAAAQSGSAGQAQVALAAGRMANAMQGATQSALNVSRMMGGPGVGNAGAVPSAVEQQMAGAYDQAARSAGSDLNSAGYAAQQLQAELDQQLFDAVRVVCEISSPKPMLDPYLVIITQYREKDDPPGTVKNWIFAKAIERLDEHPLPVRIIHGGFPPGFELLKHEIHVYGNGRELGTNVSSRHVALTRDEAHEYIVIDHLTTHKGATVAPSVALGVSSKDFYPHYGAEQVKQRVYIKVSKDGRPQGAFLDEACAKPAGDAYLEKLLAQTLFKPALKAGKAVDGVARLQIAELAL